MQQKRKSARSKVYTVSALGVLVLGGFIVLATKQVPPPSQPVEIEVDLLNASTTQVTGR